MTRSNSRRLYSVFRWIIGILFLWAAISKIANPTEFLASIYSYQIPIPKNIMKVMAITLPWVELLCALLLLANHWTESALLILAALMLAFTVATGQAWLRGLNITCGCFDLSLLGLGHRFEAFKQFWESVSVAFFRDLILLVIIYFLLRASIFKVEVSPTYCDSVNSES